MTIDPNQIRFIVAFTVSVILSVDLTIRWRGRFLPVVDIGQWRGAIPLPLVALLGGISSLTCGWVGWGLAVVAGLAAADIFKAGLPSGGLAGYERAIIVRTLLVFEVLVIAYCIRSWIMIV